MKYDNEFVIAEVNADIKYHYRNKAGKFIVMGSDTTAVGTHVSTKAVGLDKREDITLHYKYREGSAAERAALKGAGANGEEDHTKPFKFAASLISKSELGGNLTFEVTVSTSKPVAGKMCTYVCVACKYMYMTIIIMCIIIMAWMYKY